VTIDGHRLVVLRADPTRIRRIRVEPVSEVSPNGPT
jgi:CBS domain containing-hemolysin-like protein